jgi:hypothetical protein
MKNDILKFRKCVEVLISEKGYNKNKISLELKLTWPTLKKILEAPIDEIKIQASVLGILQDFLKKHCNDINYAGIKPAPEAVQKMKKNLVNYQESDKGIHEVSETANEAIKEKSDEINPSVLLSFHNEQMDKAQCEIKRLMIENTELIKELNLKSIAIKGEVLESASVLSLLEDLKKLPSNIRVQISINEK